MVFLYGTDHLELLGNLVKAFLAGFASHAGVHVRPLEVLAVGGILQVLRGGSHLAAMQVFEPQFGVFALVDGSFLKQGCYLHVSLFLGL